MKKILTFIMMILIYSCCIVTINVSAATKDVDGYSNVLDDLYLDSTFNPNDYPINKSDYSMDVITIAESENNELFVYVYNPSNVSSRQAKKISLYFNYTENQDDIDPSLYNLTLVSNEVRFQKYVVNDYNVSSSNTRYYNIISIYRPFEELIDTSIEGGTTDYKAYHVGKQFKFTDTESELTIDAIKFDTVQITVNLNGYVEYENGFTLGDIFVTVSEDHCRSHFIAFDIDNYDVDHIYDAKLSFIQISRNFICASVNSDFYVPDPDNLLTHETYNLGSSEEIRLKISDKDEVTYVGEGLFSRTYKWNRIMLSNDFISNFDNQGGKFYDLNHNSSTNDLISNSQYVFAFTETSVSVDYSYVTGSNIRLFEVNDYKISEVAILTLHFLSGIHEYNLGAVGDITTSDDIVDGIADPKSEISFEDIMQTLMMIVGLIVLLFVLNIIKPLWNFIVFIIKIPFKLIDRLFPRKRRSRK